jgi:hypothetical protein
LDRNHFNYLVRKYNGDKYVKHLTCWNQFLAMMFGQLSNRESLRDLIVALEAHHSKCYHLGMGKNVSKSSLALILKILFKIFISNSRYNKSDHNKFIFLPVSTWSGELEYWTSEIFESSSAYTFNSYNGGIGCLGTAGIESSGFAIRPVFIE